MAVARGRSSVAGLKTRATLRYTATPSTPVASATKCYGYATVLRPKGRLSSSDSFFLSLPRFSSQGLDEQANKTNTL
jgi:hypothetical protein